MQNKCKTTKEVISPFCLATLALHIKPLWTEEFLSEERKASNRQGALTRLHQCLLSKVFNRKQPLILSCDSQQKENSPLHLYIMSEQQILVRNTYTVEANALVLLRWFYWSAVVDLLTATSTNIIFCRYYRVSFWNRLATVNSQIKSGIQIIVRGVFSTNTVASIGQGDKKTLRHVKFSPCSSISTELIPWVHQQSHVILNNLLHILN